MNLTTILIAIMILTVVILVLALVARFFYDIGFSDGRSHERGGGFEEW